MNVEQTDGGDRRHTACARGAAAAAEHLWQAGCCRFFVLGAPHPDEQNTKRNGNGNGFGPRRLTAIPQRRASSNRENPRPFRSLVRKRVGKAAPALLQSGKVACRHPYAWPESAQTACGMTAPPCPRNSGYSWSERIAVSSLSAKIAVASPRRPSSCPALTAFSRLPSDTTMGSGASIPRSSNASFHPLARVLSVAPCTRPT